MPAVTVENPLTLPRLPEPVAGVPERKVLAVETAPSGFEATVEVADVGVPAHPQRPQQIGGELGRIARQHDP